MKNWTLDELKSRLSQRPEVKGWIVAQEHIHRRERYFMADRPEADCLAIDQDRDVRAQSITARVIVRSSREGRQGETVQKLFPSMPLDSQLDTAIDAAAQTDHQTWELPEPPSSQLAPIATADPMIAEDIDRAMSKLTEEVASIVSEKRASRFNSAELFVSIHDREMHLSSGYVHRSAQSRIYAEAAYSMSRKGPKGKLEADEYLNTTWSVSLDDLKLRELFHESAERAEHSLEVQRPTTARYPVVIDSEVLAMLFNSRLSHLSGSSSYHRLPFLKPGEEFIPGATGDLVTLRLDPTLRYGADSSAISEQGVPQSPLTLVDSGRVTATSTDKQHADYLGIAPTTSRGDLVVEPGTLSYGELLKNAPQVLEILQFSALFPDPHSGTFSSEIRLARLHDNVKGTVAYVKGGSLSGSIDENFKKVRLSRETVKKAHFAAGNSGGGQGYFGPAYALLNDVSVVG